MTKQEKNKIVGGTLYLVATPIGNLSDLSERAIKVLAEVDFVAAEDTRNTALLLSTLDLKKELVSYHEHNRASRGPELIARLLAGESCALCSDAGMPVISDPGEDLVKLCASSGIPVTCIPGPNAALMALVLSALPADRFAFEGFLPASGKERSERIRLLLNETRTLLFYEAPHRLKKTLQELYDALGERPVALCRELTKLNEEVFRGTLSSAIALYQEREPKGEYVLVLGGGAAEKEENPLLKLTPEEHIAYYEKEGLSRMDAIKAAAKDRGMSKRELYKRKVLS